ncbi:uncharacterized protein LOC142583167 isoform X1 [Dermacentor variabilis]|uniref:uncharacterized protein LOC142583167 isoform X1 n=1 Tax=Dermacentor variabilis TaxID=34621 RepID=UPI003F5B3918
MSSLPTSSKRSSPDRYKRPKCCGLHCIFHCDMGDRNGQRRPDAYERLPAGSDLCHISLNVSGTLWRLLPLRPTTTLSRLRPLGSWEPLAASATASCHHHAPTTSTRELAALVMMPSRLTADRNIQVALKFYPSHATYSGQASCELHITRLNASVSSESGDQGNLLCNQRATLGDPSTCSVYFTAVPQFPSIQTASPAVSYLIDYLSNHG